MSRRFVLITVVAVLAGIAWAAYAILTGSVLRQLGDGSLVDADYWSDEPRILSAGLGFDNIIGISELTPEAVRAAGGAWNASLACADGSEPPLSARTSAATPDAVALAYRGYADYDDGLPVVFSWPVAGETVDPADFRFTLNTGERVFPHAAGLFPNWERNERNVVVLFGDFGNRGRPGEADAMFPAAGKQARSGSPGRPTRRRMHPAPIWSAPSSTASATRRRAKAVSPCLSAPPILPMTSLRSTAAAISACAC